MVTFCLISKQKIVNHESGISTNLSRQAAGNYTLVQIKLAEQSDIHKFNLQSSIFIPGLSGSGLFHFDKKHQKRWYHKNGKNSGNRQPPSTTLPTR
jgi:hypothetical protein